MLTASTAPPRSLSIVIPLFNEEENLRPLIAALFTVLGDDPSFAELILVNDGSRDRTAAFATDLAAQEPRIRLVQHERNRGLGAAIRTGIAAATGDFILYTDADLPFDFTLIPQLRALADDTNIVMGCRANRGEGARRWVLTKTYNFACLLLFGFRLRDINFACKLIPGPAAHRMSLASEGSFIDAEMLLEGRRQGLRIVELPMTYFPRTRGESTLSRPSVVFGILRELGAYLFRTARETVTQRVALAAGPYLLGRRAQHAPPPVSGVPEVVNEVSQ